jgi:hypothetical protein
MIYLTFSPITVRIHVELNHPRTEEIPVDQDLKDHERAPTLAVMVDGGLGVHGRTPSLGVASERER